MPDTSGVEKRRKVFFWPAKKPSAPIIPQPVYSLLHNRKRHDKMVMMALNAFKDILQQSMKSINNMI